MSRPTLPRLVISENTLPTRNFPLFSLLPLEVRSQIWAEASKVPRIIALKPNDMIIPHSFYTANAPKDKAPALLFVSIESREEGLRHYTNCLERFPWSIWDYEHQLITTYVNFKVDVFIHPHYGRTHPSFTTRRNAYNFGPEYLEQIQNLDMNFRLGWGPSRQIDAPFFTSLKNFNFVLQLSALPNQRMDTLQAHLLRKIEENKILVVQVTALLGDGTIPMGFKWPRTITSADLDPCQDQLMQLVI